MMRASALGRQQVGRATAIGLALLIGVGWLVEGWDHPVGRGIVAAGGGLALAAMVTDRPPTGRLYRAAAVPLALLTAALVWTLATSLGLAGAQPTAPDLMPEGTVASAGLLALFVSATLLGARRVPMDGFARTLVLLAAGSIVLGLLLRNAATPEAWRLWNVDNHGRFLGTLGNANVAAAAYGATALLALGMAMERGLAGRPGRRLRGRETMLVVLSLAGIAATAATGSRTGGLLTLLGVALVAAPRGDGRAARVRWAAAIVLAVAVALITILWMLDLLPDRLTQLGPDVAVRPLMWRHYAGIVADAPWRGHGFDAFGALNVRHLTDVPLAEALWTVNAPHDLFLTLALEGGVPRLVLTGVAMLIVGSAIVRGARRRAARGLEAAMAATLVLLLGLGAVDIALDVPATAALTMVLAGWLWGRTLPRDLVGVAPPQRDPARQNVAIAG